MARALIIIMLFWGISLGGFILLRRIPKGSPLYGIRDFFWMFFLATTTVVVLAIVAILTGIFTIGDTPFNPSKP